MKDNRRRKTLMGTTLQKKILALIFTSAIIPTAIVALCLYYLIFNLFAWQLGIPESIAYNLIPVSQKVNLIILISLPLVLIFIWFVALRFSHRIVGPIYRIERDLDAIMEGKKADHIKIRNGDEFGSLVKKINDVLDKYNKGV